MFERFLTLVELEDLLKTIHQGGDKAAEAWTKLYVLLGPDPEDITGRGPDFDWTVTSQRQWEQLKSELVARKVNQCDCLYRLAEYARGGDSGSMDRILQWITAQPTIEARIIALRLAARLIGHTECFGRTVLLGIARDDNQSTDLRAWALYNLHWADIAVDIDAWSECKTDFCDNILNCNEAKVRQWAVYALGEMANYGTMQNGIHGTRLIDTEARTEVEEALIARWYCETDFYVLDAIVHSLQYAGGYARNECEFRLTDVLKQAAKHRSREVRRGVPDAISGVAKTFCRQPSRLCNEQATALVELLDIMSVWLGEDGLEYDSYRSAILAVENVVECVLPHQEWEEEYATNLEVAKRGLSILLATGESFAVNDPKAHDLVSDVRSRALFAIAVLGEQRHWALCCFPDHSEQSPLLALAVADPDDKVSKQAIDTLKTMAGDEQAAQHFVRVILEQNLASEIANASCRLWSRDDKKPDLDILDGVIRKNAAIALGGIEKNNAAHDRLVEALRIGEGEVCIWAREALMVMGGRKAISAIVSEAKRKFVQSVYFEPIEKADDAGQKILERTVRIAERSFYFVLIVSGIVVLIGVGLAMVTFGLILQNTPANLKDIAIPALASAVTLLVGLLAPYFWDPSRAVQRANAEMTKLVTAYQGFVGRMRLLGLGFAHAYTEAEWQKSTRFLSSISLAARDAMRDSTDILSGISHWPDVQVPDLTRRTWKDAHEAARAYGFEIGLEKLQHDSQLEGMIVSQTPAAGVMAKAGSEVQLTVSKGQT